MYQGLFLFTAMVSILMGLVVASGQWMYEGHCPLLKILALVGQCIILTQYRMWSKKLLISGEVR